MNERKFELIYKDGSTVRFFALTLGDAFSRMLEEGAVGVETVEA